MLKLSETLKPYLNLNLNLNFAHFVLRLDPSVVKIKDYATFAPSLLRLHICASDICASRHLRLVTVAPPTVAPGDICASTFAPLKHEN